MKKFFKRLLTFIAIIILLACLTFGLYVFKIYKEIQSQGSEIQLSQNNAAINQVKTIAENGINNYWTGTSSPKVTIVEFSDFKCPFCAQSFPKTRELSIKYKNDIKIIYRDFPLNEISIDLAISARCAGEQDLFWLMHDKLFQHQGEINTKENIINLAKSIGLNITQFQKCLSSGKYKNHIQRDFSDGTNLGVSGTPTWFINGNKLEGNLSIEAWEEIINKLINK